MTGLLGWIKTFGRMFGLELSFYNMHTSVALQRRRIFEVEKIGTVLDIGANTGQYAMDLRSDGFSGRIISFEPLSAAYEKLKENSRKDRDWLVAERMAVGDSDGEVAINVSANSVSSSVLPVMPAHVAAAPESAYIDKENVRIARLDTLGAGLELRGDVFIKIDVQGFEMAVLKGANEFLKRRDVRGLQLELSLVELYSGQASMTAVIDYLENRGYVLSAMSPVFIDADSGRTLQIDGVFLKVRNNVKT